MLPGILIGAMMPYLFSALTMMAVGKAAHQIVVEVRRQFREIPGVDGRARGNLIMRPALASVPKALCVK
jgi:Inorganic pyrophosphatase